MSASEGNSPNVVQNGADDLETEPLLTKGDCARQMAKLLKKYRHKKFDAFRVSTLIRGYKTLWDMYDAQSIRDYTDEEILAEWDRRKTERQKVSAEQ